MPAALGGREPWCLVAAAALLALCWALWLAAASCRGELRTRGDRLLFLPAVLLAMGCAQMIPGRLWNVLASANASRWRELAEALGARLSPRACLAPSHAFDAMGVIALVLAFSLLAYQIFGERRHVFLLASAVVGAALLNALLGYAALLDVAPVPYATLRGPTEAMAGTFWNRNHFGLLMVFGAVQTAGLALAAWFTHAYQSRRPHGLGLYFELHWRGLVVGLAVALLALAGAGLLSTSRGAFLGGGLGLLLLFGLALRRRRARSRLLAVSLFAVLLGVIGGHAALGRVTARFDSLLAWRELGTDVRMRIWRESLVVLREHWLAGIGPEGFRSVSPRYEGPWKGGLISLHAHNEYLELLIEYGIPLGAPVLLATLAWLILALRRCARQRDPLLCWLGLGAGCALVAAAIHSLFDYPLRSPGMLTVAGAAAVVLSLAGRCRNGRASCRRWHPPRVLRPVGFASAALLVAVAAWQTPRAFAAARARARLRDLTEPHRRPLAASSILPTSRTAIDLSNRVLSRWPLHVLACNARGAARHAIAVAEWREMAIESDIVSVDLAGIAASLEQAVEDLRVACLLDPGNSRNLILLARATESWQILENRVEETRLRRVYELAAAAGPSIPDTVFGSADGLWRSWLRTGRADDSARAQAVAMYAAGVRLVPRAAGRVLAQLRAAGYSPAEMRAAMPDHILVHEALYAEFARQALYEECLRELDTIEVLNQQRPRTTKVVHYTPEDSAQAPPPVRVVADSVADRRIHVLGMLGRWGERSELALRRAQSGSESQRAQIEKALRWFADGSPDSALPLVQEVCREAPDFGEAHLHACRILRSVGRNDDALAALLPLLYRADSGFSPELYRLATAEVESELTHWLAVDPPPAYARFLPVAFEVQAAVEADSPVSESTLHGLEGMAAQIRSRSAGAWAQAHLAEYYLGLAHAGRSDPAQATEAFARVLAQCPRHLGAARRLARTPEPHARELAVICTRARELVALADQLVPLVGDLNPWLRLLGFRFEPLTAQPLGPVRLTAMLLCTGQPSGGGKLALRFFQSEEGSFSSSLPLLSPEGDPPAWRVGQVVVLTTEVNPTLAAIRGGHPLRGGPHFLSFRFEPSAGVPADSRAAPIAALAFQVDPETRAPTYVHD